MNKGIFTFLFLIIPTSVVGGIAGTCKLDDAGIPGRTICANTKKCTTDSGKAGKCVQYASGCRCDIINVVELSNLTATPTDKGVLLDWKTETEPDSQGFRIWRATPDLGLYCGCSINLNDYTKISVLDKNGKPILIPAKGDKVSGADYSHLDKEAKPGIAYCYALEDIDSKGESKLYFEYIVFTPDSVSE
jgi:hypothetical protein